MSTVPSTSAAIVHVPRFTRDGGGISMATVHVPRSRARKKRGFKTTVSGSTLGSNGGNHRGWQDYAGVRPNRSGGFSRGDVPSTRKLRGIVLATGASATVPRSVPMAAPWLVGALAGRP